MLCAVSPLSEALIAKLTPGDPRPGPEPRRRAAVAIVLHDRPEGPRVLLMKRAERDGDPWSGHISLPGGRLESFDADLHAASIREAREELGLDLDRTRYLGQLAALQPFSSGPAGIEVTPFVFLSDSEPAAVCGPEALSAFWLPLLEAAAGAYDGTYTYPGTDRTFPSWTYEGHVIWGLTWRILADLLSLAK